MRLAPFERVGILDPESRLGALPHELSGVSASG